MKYPKGAIYPSNIAENVDKISGSSGPGYVKYAVISQNAKKRKCPKKNKLTIQNFRKE